MFGSSCFRPFRRGDVFLSFRRVGMIAWQGEEMDRLTPTHTEEVCSLRDGRLDLDEKTALKVSTMATIKSKRIRALYGGEWFGFVPFPSFFALIITCVFFFSLCSSVFWVGERDSLVVTE